MKVFLGVMAVLLFVSVYSLYTEPATGTEAPARSSASIADWFPGAFMILFASAYLWMHRVRRQSQDLVPALSALRERRLGDARHLLAQARETHGRNPFLGPVIHLNEGLAHLQLGDLERAEASLLRADRPGWFAAHQDLRVQSALALAQVVSLAGRSWVGRHWLAEATRRRDGLGAPLAHRGELLFAEMVMLVREGRFDRAVALHDASAAELERTEPVHRLRLWWALAAYATWHLADPRSDAAAEPLLRKLRTCEPHDLAHLVVRWSELRVFLETHGVAANAVARLDAPGPA